MPHACFDGSISNKEVVNHGTQAFCCTSPQCSKVSGILRDFLGVKGESVLSFCCKSPQCSKVSGILRDFLAVKGESVSSFFAYQI